MQSSCFVSVSRKSNLTNFAKGANKPPFNTFFVPILAPFLTPAARLSKRLFVQGFCSDCAFRVWPKAVVKSLVGNLSERVFSSLLFFIADDFSAGRQCPRCIFFS